MMKTIINILLLLGVGMAGFSQPDWKEYIFDPQNFKIAFIQEPEYSLDSSDFNGFPLISNFWELNVNDTLHENIYYSVSEIGYPSDFIHSDSLFSTVEGFISSTQSSLIGNDNFTLLGSSLTEKHGYPGKIFKWKSNPNGVFLEFHVYLVENKLFELAVVTKLTDKTADVGAQTPGLR